MSSKKSVSTGPMRLAVISVNVIFIIIVSMYDMKGVCHDEAVKVSPIRNGVLEDQYVSFYLAQVSGCYPYVKEGSMKTYRKERWFEVPTRRAGLLKCSRC